MSRRRRYKKNQPFAYLLTALIISGVTLFSGGKLTHTSEQPQTQVSQNTDVAEVNNNNPYFKESDLNPSCFESYSPLDSLGRCQVAYACVGKETMPTEERGAIGMIKPSGWHTVKYPHLINGNYLYNRCHLIAYCLTGENANERNLITGTRYLNENLMLPYETKVAKYIDENPSNHVLYRVTPEYDGNNLVASTVLMEAYSIEDNGAGIKFCVRLKNIQPGIEIDYSNGESHEK